MALGVIECRVQNSVHSGELWAEIQKITQKVRDSLTFESIKDQPQIAATRGMYSLCGKDPSRYRPSAEALMRRIVKGQELYRISTLVDLINLVSLKSGYSIGGFDASLIEQPVVAGLGKTGEIFNAIGRGVLNIENLPVLRDAKGPIGTPTSDEERTSIRSGTGHLLMVFNAYNGSGDLSPAMDYAVGLLNKHADAIVLNREIITL
ncbi:MAG: hypothetical protein JXA72_02490 [Bacteroidales bacterium]|nr:hypothetical protein [Bacteroidales bacterium]